MATTNLSLAATITTIGQTMLVLIPKDASSTLPSRGAVMVQGSLNDQPFTAPLEPDGRGSHWLKIDAAAPRSAALKTGDTVAMEFQAISDWPEPTVPEDLQHALDKAATAGKLWQQITPMARWDWIRWIRATNNPATRTKRISVAISKLNAGSRRPCCFNRSECTDPTVSKSGKLILA